MIEIYVITAIALVATGVVIGVIAVVSLGIRREDRRGSLPADTNDRIARGARRLTGLYIRVPEPGSRSQPPPAGHSAGLADPTGAGGRGVSGPASQRPKGAQRPKGPSRWAQGGRQPQ